MEITINLRQTIHMKCKSQNRLNSTKVELHVSPRKLHLFFFFFFHQNKMNENTKFGQTKI